MWGGRTNIPDRCCQRPARFWDRLSTLGLPSRLCAAGPIDRFVLPQSPSRSRRREIGFSSERTGSAWIECILLDGRADTPVTTACDLRRKLDTFLSPKCCKAQDMAVSALSHRACLWNSGATGMCLELALLLSRITDSWAKGQGLADELERFPKQALASYLRRSSCPRERRYFDLAGLRTGW